MPRGHVLRPLTPMPRHVLRHPTPADPTPDSTSDTASPLSRSLCLRHSPTPMPRGHVLRHPNPADPTPNSTSDTESPLSRTPRSKVDVARTVFCHHISSRTLKTTPIDICTAHFRSTCSSSHFPVLFPCGLWKLHVINYVIDVSHPKSPAAMSHRTRVLLYVSPLLMHAILIFVRRILWMVPLHMISWVSVMSSFFLNGFFAVKSGRRVVMQHVVNESTMKTNYIHYQTALQCTTGVSYGAELRVFATSQSTILPDDSVVHVVAKAEINPGTDAFLEANSFSVIPGDPSADDYEDHVPDDLYPHVFILGQVMKEIPIDMKITAYTIMASDYIRDNPSQSLIQFASASHV